MAEVEGHRALVAPRSAPTTARRRPSTSRAAQAVAARALDLDHVAPKSPIIVAMTGPANSVAASTTFSPSSGSGGVRAESRSGTGPSAREASSKQVSLCRAVAERVVDEAPVDLDRRGAGGLGGLERDDDPPAALGLLVGEPVDALDGVDVPG